MKKENAAFRKRLGGLKGGEQAMKAVGFRLESNGQFVMSKKRACKFKKTSADMSS